MIGGVDTGKPLLQKVMLIILEPWLKEDEKCTGVVMSDKVIYKYGPITFDGANIKGRVVHVGLQDYNVFVWTEQEVDINMRYLDRTVRLYPTGLQFKGNYLGTVVIPSGIVWHVIEDIGL